MYSKYVSLRHSFLAIQTHKKYIYSYLQPMAWWWWQRMEWKWKLQICCLQDMFNLSLESWCQLCYTPSVFHRASIWLPQQVYKTQKAFQSVRNTLVKILCTVRTAICWRPLQVKGGSSECTSPWPIPGAECTNAHSPSNHCPWLLNTFQVMPGNAMWVFSHTDTWRCSTESLACYRGKPEHGKAQTSVTFLSELGAQGLGSECICSPRVIAQLFFQM